MTIQQFQCPSCGASLEVDKDKESITCTYCGQFFVLDKPLQAEEIAEVEKKFGVRTIAITAVFLVVIVIAIVVIVASIGSNTADIDIPDNSISIDADFPEISVPDVSVPELVVEKDYYTFRTESSRQIAYEKQNGTEMGFADAEAYEAGANEVIFSPDTLTGIADDGCRKYYNEQSNFFVKLYDDGTIRLFCMPDNGKDFFEEN